MSHPHLQWVGHLADYQPLLSASPNFLVVEAKIFCQFNHQCQLQVISIILTRSDKDSQNFRDWLLGCAGLPSIYFKTVAGIGCGNWSYSTSLCNFLGNFLQKFICHGITTMFTKWYPKCCLFFTL